MSVGDTESLIDQIYEAAILPELWREVLAKLAVIGDGALASLFAFDRGAIKFVGTLAAETLIADYIALGRPDLNTRIPRRLQLVDSGFRTDHDIFTDSEIDAEPFYRDFLHPRGYGWVAATCARPPSGEMLSVSVERHLTRGPFEKDVIDRLNVFSSHLARSVMLSARLGMERVRAAAQALEMIGLPATLLGPTHKMLAANRPFEALLTRTITEAGGRVRLVNAAADALLETALRRLGNDGQESAVMSIPIAAAGDESPVICHVVPVRGAARDIFSHVSAILIFTMVSPTDVPGTDVLQGLFDLTAAEARIAQGIGGGLTVDALADRLGIASGTVRTQLKAVFQKTGVSRQVELARLLAGSGITPR